MIRHVVSLILLAGLLGLAGCTREASPSPAVSDVDTPVPATPPPMRGASTAAIALEPPMTAPPMSDPLPAQQMSCDAELAKPAALGQRATAEVVEQARKDAGAQIARVLKPDQMVTMEFIEGRLNIDVNDNNVITNVRCG